MREMQILAFCIERVQRLLERLEMMVEATINHEDSRRLHVLLKCLMVLML